MTQPDLFTRLPSFDGATFDPALDEHRLRSQLGRVYALMNDGQWRTIAEVKAQARGSEGGVHARLRDLRKLKFGAYVVERRRCGDEQRGLYEYRLRRTWDTT